MNAFLYIISYVSVAGALSLVAWTAARALRLPGWSRAILGFAATPLVLPLLTLTLTLVWPNTPRQMLLAWPLLLLFSATAFNRVRTRAAFAAVVRRIRRVKFSASGSLTALLIVSLLGVATFTIWGNARQPIPAHDALVYFNESRLFANHPSWQTYLDMTNPHAPGALVRGHTHTWFYTSFIATALMATDGNPGPDHDLIARIFTQANLLILIAAVGGLSWSLSGRSGFLTLLAMSASASIPHISYITAATSVDAFRILPLVLAAMILSTGPRSDTAWRLTAGLLAVAAAAHTLNIIFGPLLIIARLTAGMTDNQWLGFKRFFLPAFAISMLTVGAFYIYVWTQTGRFFGNGMHYNFYVGALSASPFARGMLAPSPSFANVVRSLTLMYGAWPILVPICAATIGLPKGWHCAKLRFMSHMFLLFSGAIVSGCWDGVTQKLTYMMLENIRYSLGIWVFGPSVAVAAIACVTRAIGKKLVRPRRTSLLFAGPALLSIIATGAGAREIIKNWPMDIDARQYLEAGEWEVARLADRCAAGNGQWLTDQNTVAYYSRSSPVFLYTPGGVEWITLQTKEDAWRRLSHDKIKLVAFNNLDPEWWPKTALYAALTQPEHATRIRLYRWELFVLRGDALAKSPPSPGQP